MNRKSIQGAFLAAGVAMALSGAAFADDGKMMEHGGKVTCKESNSCAGKGSCGGTANGAKHDCGGKNGCAGNVREVSKDECAKIKGTVVKS